jgi:hypothetical protein
LGLCDSRWESLRNRRLLRLPAPRRDTIAPPARSPKPAGPIRGAHFLSEGSPRRSVFGTLRFEVGIAPKPAPSSTPRQRRTAPLRLGDRIRVGYDRPRLSESFLPNSFDYTTNRPTTITTTTTTTRVFTSNHPLLIDKSAGRPSAGDPDDRFTAALLFLGASTSNRQQSNGEPGVSQLCHGDVKCGTSRLIESSRRRSKRSVCRFEFACFEGTLHRIVRVESCLTSSDTALLSRTSIRARLIGQDKIDFSLANALQM